MNKAKDRIYIQQWLELKPYDKQISTDSFYLKLSNEVKQAIFSTNQVFALQMYLDNEEINTLSCFLTSYFEDIISGTNIWNSFVKHHTELYQKQLPFFEIDEYYEDDINIQDICFLTWYFLNTIQQEKFISAYNVFFAEIAEKVFDVFEAAWDDAPENKVIKTYYTFDATETDFYKARNLIDTILFKTYLFYPDTKLDLLDAELEVIEENKDNKDKENLLTYLNETRDYILHKAHTRLLVLKGNEWASKILGENNPLYQDFLNLSPKIRGYFFYKGQDDKDVFIEHIASGKKFNLTKKSFDHAHLLKEIDTILYMGIVRWQNEWWFSGLFFPTKFDADLILDEKNSMESRMSVNFLDHQKQEVKGILKQQFEAFKIFSHGAEIVFLDSDKIEDFLAKYTAYYNTSLQLSEKETEEASQRAKADGFFGGEKKTT